ncbi:retrotransposon protein, putative, ty1-copia subclass [Tanacetum coccineum]
MPRGLPAIPAQSPKPPPDHRSTTVNRGGQRWPTTVNGGGPPICGEAILTATYLLYEIRRKELEETHYELWMRRKPSYQYLRVWGCPTKVVVPTPKAKKIRPKSVDCIFIGYAKNNTAYRFIVHESKNPDIQKNTVMESRNASFFENTFPCLTKETGSSSRSDGEVVQDKRQRYDNDLQDERQDQPRKRKLNQEEAKGQETLDPILFLLW